MPLTGKDDDNFEAGFDGALPRDAAPFRQEFGKDNSLTGKIIITSCILIISLATVVLLHYGLPVWKPELPEWRPAQGTAVQKTASVKTPLPVPQPAPVQQMPKFVPRVQPDGAYAVNHPGWERYEADHLEYLLYREQGRIRAIQVVSEENGEIGMPLLKTCIREITGQEGWDSRGRETRKDYLVEKGILQNGGELAVYRKMPDNDIRGFVITFP